MQGGRSRVEWRESSGESRVAKRDAVVERGLFRVTGNGWREKKWRDVLRCASRVALRASGGVGGHRHASYKRGLDAFGVLDFSLHLNSEREV